MTDIHAKLLEEKILRGIRAKRRFRSAVRHVIHNLSWLQDVDDGEVIDPSNIKQTVTRIARRRKTNKAQVLSIREKSILRKDIKYRTDDEKKLLNKYIGGLKCFRRYPEDVQMELVGVTYFEYYGPGRVLLKQNHEAHALYFLLSGEVVVSKRQWDAVANVEVDVELNKIVAGNMFGEVSLLHNVTRTATVATIAPCELLVLKKLDFDRVLKASLMQLWDDIREAMTIFTYFDQWDSVAVRECCILSKIKSYVPNQVVFGDYKRKKGTQVHSYFLIEGRCSVIEHLFIEERVKRGIKCYKLYEPPETNTEGVPSYGERFRMQCEERFSRSVAEQDDELQRNRDSYGDDKRYSNEDPSIEHGNRRISIVTIRGSRRESRRDSKIDFRRDSKIEFRRDSRRGSMIESRRGSRIESRRDSKRDSWGEPKRDSWGDSWGEKREKMSIVSYKNLLQLELLSGEVNPMHGLRSTLPPHVQLRFMQICTLGSTATFVEGPLMKNRRVIALTPVRMLLIPAYWLIQHNKGNVWTRVEHFLRNRIPSKHEVFNAYVTDKRWQDYRRKLRNDILSKRKFYNNTTVHDIPYSIRVVSNYE